MLSGELCMSLLMQPRARDGYTHLVVRKMMCATCGVPGGCSSLVEHLHSSRNHVLQVFAARADAPPGDEWAVYLSCMQIYLENLEDLLNLGGVCHLDDVSQGMRLELVLVVGYAVGDRA